MKIKTCINKQQNKKGWIRILIYDSYITLVPFIYNNIKGRCKMSNSTKNVFNLSLSIFL